jgi:hypothetical protein
MSVVPSERPNTTPLWIAGGGLALIALALPFGSKAIAAASVLFLGAALLALVETRATIWTWGTAMVFLVALIWLIPIKLYAFPIEVGFRLEPYRVVVILFTLALVAAAAMGRIRLTAAGAGPSLALLAGVAILTQIVNYGTLNAGGDETALKSLSYMLGFILVFVLVASVLTSMERLDDVLRALVVCAVVVALFAVYEGRSNYNVFNHLSDWIPGLERQQREVYAERGGRLRVHASAQHPIALGVALAMMVPFALYLTGRASTVLRSRLWVAAAGVITIGAVTTISRTTVLMFTAMVAVGLALRGRMMLRFWPLLLVLPFVIHFASPGALGGLYKSFSPRGGFVAEFEGRPGQGGSGRLADVEPGLKLWEQKPIIGHGLGSELEPVAEPGAQLAGAAIIFDNQWLNSLVSMGAVGIFALLWFMLGSTFKLFRAARAKGPRSDLMAASCVAATGFVASMLVFDALAFVQATLVFFIVVAIGLRARELPASGLHVVRSPEAA